jgi:hypothetical protein
MGGWGYTVDVLNNQEATLLMSTLKKSRPKLPPMIEKAGPATGLADQIRMLNPLEKAGGTLLPTGIDRKPSSDKSPPAKDNMPPTTGPTPPGDVGVAGEKPAPPDLPAKQLPKVALAQQPKVAQPPKGPKDKGQPKQKTERGDDNSNSQFAMLALWAARRHDVPVENALLLAEQRYRMSQHKETGGWSYHYKEDKDRPSMTCVGLLGLALGRGVTIEMQLKAGYSVPKTPQIDEQARDGFLKGVAPYLLKENAGGQVYPPGGGLYFMWSVERVAVLYDVVKIGDQDWYLWGVDILLPSQMPNGSWQTGSYHGSNPHVDTCFALLFLKRVNLVQDLTDLNLRLYMAIPESK